MNTEHGTENSETENPRRGTGNPGTEKSGKTGRSAVVNPLATPPVCKPEPRLRADALRNRERIVAAAREMFVEHGPDISLDEVARRAGVGNATLYRHFTDRVELVRRVTLYVTDRVADEAAAALAEEADGFEALSRFVHAAVAERVGALCPLLAGVAQEDGELARRASS